MKAEFEVKLTTKDMFVFLLNNTYRKLTGIIWMVFSVVVVGVVIFTWGKEGVQLYQSILLIVLASLYTIINPIMLLFRAARQIKTNETLRKPLHYVVDEEGITVSQGELSEKTPWENIWKAVKYGDQVVIYVTQLRVFNMPLRFVGDQYEALAGLAKEGLKERCKLKG